MKKRLDILVAERFSLSREKAKALIMAGNILVDGEKNDKAGTMTEENAALSMAGEAPAYVSRGGLKLEKAMQVYPIRLEDKICIDGRKVTIG